MPETFTKRRHAMERQRKRKEKEARRQERKEMKAQREPRGDGEDPDIAGIVPGPQPKLYE
jgi:hypothetical protein